MIRLLLVLLATAYSLQPTACFAQGGQTTALRVDPATKVHRAALYGGTPAEQIAACLTALQAQGGGECDASGIRGAQAISSNIFSGITAPVRLRLAADYTLSVDLTVPPNVILSFEPGAAISVNSGKTLTIAAAIHRPPIPIFGGTGHVVITSKRIEQVLLPWFATAGSGTLVDPWTGWEGGINNQPTNTRIFAPAGYYTFSPPLILASGSSLLGAGIGQTFFQVVDHAAWIEAGNYYSITTELNASDITFADFTVDGNRANIKGYDLPRHVSNATNTAPIVVTAYSHGLTAGDYVWNIEVEGNTAANGVFAVTVLDGDRYSLDGSTGNGAFTPGTFARSLKRVTSGGVAWNEWRADNIRTRNVTNLTIRNVETRYASGLAGIRIQGGNKVRMDNVIAHHNAYAGLYLGQTALGPYPLINSQFSNLTAYDNGGWDASNGIFLDGVSDSTFTNITAYTTTAYVPRTVEDATGNGVSPIVLEVTAHGYLVGDGIEVQSMLGNTAANGIIWAVDAVPDVDHIQLRASKGNGAYTPNSGFISKLFTLGTSPIKLFNSNGNTFSNLVIYNGQWTGVHLAAASKNIFSGGIIHDNISSVFGTAGIQLDSTSANNRFESIRLADNGRNVLIDTTSGGNSFAACQFIRGGVLDPGAVLFKAGEGLRIHAPGTSITGSLITWNASDAVSVTAAAVTEMIVKQNVISNNGGWAVNGGGYTPEIAVTNNEVYGNASGKFNGLAATSAVSLNRGAADTKLDFNTVNYQWPASQGAVDTILANDGAGILSWAAAWACPTCVVTTGSYADPGWITSLGATKITGEFGNITSAVTGSNQAYFAKTTTSGNASYRFLDGATDKGGIYWNRTTNLFELFDPSGGSAMTADSSHNINIAAGGLQMGATEIVSAARALQNVTADGGIITSGTVASPRLSNTSATFGGFYPGPLTSTWVGGLGSYYATNTVTVTAIAAYAKTAPVGCSPNAVVRVGDFDGNYYDLTIAWGTNHAEGSLISAVVGYIQVSLHTAAAGCSTPPADMNVTVSFKPR